MHTRDELERQRIALGSVTLGPAGRRAAEQLEADAARLAAKIRAKEHEARRAAGAQEERAAIVRWLREEWAPHFPPGSSARSEILGGAELIEAGEHRK